MLINPTWWHIKLSCHFWTWHPMRQHLFEFQLLSFWYNFLGRQKMGPVLESLACTWESQVEFLTFGLNLTAKAIYAGNQYKENLSLSPTITLTLRKKERKKRKERGKKRKRRERKKRNKKIIVTFTHSNTKCVMK